MDFKIGVNYSDTITPEDLLPTIAQKYNYQGTYC